MKRIYVAIGGTVLGLGLLLADVTQTGSANPAIIPHAKLENDFYQWEQRHAAVLETKRAKAPQIVLLGDSITHLWGGLPQEPKGNRGAKAWEALFGKRVVLNAGFGWDRTQNVLWRIEHGTLEQLTPKLIVLNIGTNNLAGTKNCRAATPLEISEGILAVVERCEKLCPKAKLVVMGVFPRGKKADDPKRAAVAEINRFTAEKLKSKPAVTFLDIGSQFLNAAGEIEPGIMPDALHPAEAGYTIWAKALEPFVKEIPEA
jgi:lysophospholipase L1-like esterase